MTKPWLPLALLLLTLTPAAVRGDDGDAPQVFELRRASVLTSPGTPKALEPFLPGGTLGRRLTWPLPDGPLLVLGLPDSDPIARELADAFHLRAGPEDLRGGYGLWAWHDGKRPLVFVFGADPAALYAARFEFDAAAPMGSGNPSARSLDFDRPNEEAGLVVKAGTRLVRPRFRLRGWAPGADLPPGAQVTAAGARSNRVWLEPELLGRERTIELIGQLREHGAIPVVVLRARQARMVDNRIRIAEDDPVRADEWQRDFGIQHFALDIPSSPLHVGARSARRLADRLRLRGLEELVVIPRAHSDRLAEELGPPPDLRDIPEAVIAWSGPVQHSVEITRADAERRVREAGVPVVLLDRWAAPFQTSPSHVPCAPYGRAWDLHEVLEGVIVVGARHAEASLDSAWGPSSEERFGASQLTRLLPVGDVDAPTFLAKGAAALERQAREDRGLVTWMRPLAGVLRAAAAGVEAGRIGIMVPVVPRGVVLDGHVDESSWGYARSLGLETPDIDVLALSDGRCLYLALRVRDGPTTRERGPLEVHLRVPETGGIWKLPLQVGEVHTWCEPEGHAIDHVRSAVEVRAGRTVAEIRFDRFALFGEAIPTRRFDVSVHWGARRLWPPAESKSDYGLLVVTR